MSRALRLINVFRPEELGSKRLAAWVQERNDLGRSESVFETREFIIAKNAQARDSAREKGKNIPAVLEAIASVERDVPEYVEADHNKFTAKFVRVPTLDEVPYPVQMEPNLVVEFYSS